uniref:FHA domain-containing protein n=1 Tax=Colobus angolensis palliatus TaxID=336983 RepID=A0A2K5J1P6_COLAP
VLAPICNSPGREGATSPSPPADATGPLGEWDVYRNVKTEGWVSKERISRLHRLRMADILSQSEPLALQELSGDFKKPALPVPAAARSKAPATSSSNPEEVQKEGPTALQDSSSGEPDVPPLQPDCGDFRSLQEEQSRPPTAVSSSGGSARAPPYQEPPWGGPATAPYSLETLKGGTILGTRSLKGTSYCLFGRLSGCDVCLEHPSVSRYHAVLQHRASGPDGECDSSGPGFYLYDLGSTHGTFLNKTRIPPRTYCRVHVGHVVRFGGSTRLFILQGPEEDREAESELTVTQLKELRKQQQILLEKKMLGEDSDEEEEMDTSERKINAGSQDDEMGCTWGMVSRKRKAKNWEDEDFYDSDDDTFLDRTGLVEKKRLNRMKKAGKIDEKPETFESLVAKLNDAERELSEISERLKASSQVLSESPSQDSLDAFMSEMKSGSTLDGVSRKKLHLRTFELRKEQQRLKGLIKIVKPAEIPELKKTESQTTSAENKAKKLTLPLFGAMKGGSKFKLKTGTVGKLPPKRPELPPTLMRMKDEPEVEEEEEEEEEEEKEKEEHEKKKLEDGSLSRPQPEIEPEAAVQEMRHPTDLTHFKETQTHENMSQLSEEEQNKDYQDSSETTSLCEGPSASKNEYEKSRDELKKKKAPGPGKLPPTLSSKYPEDDPDYCVWVPPEGQSGDGRTHLNDKYGY